MNWNSPLGIALFLGFSTGVLSLSQAWVLQSNSLRWPRYLLVWLLSGLLLAWAGGLVLEVDSGQGTVRDEVRTALLVSALAIAAIAFTIGARWRGTQVSAAGNLFGRFQALYGLHFAVVFFGSCAALLVIIVIGLSHIH
jgi:hypothetical protein